MLGDYSVEPLHLGVVWVESAERWIVDDSLHPFHRNPSFRHGIVGVPRVVERFALHVVRPCGW